MPLRVTCEYKAELKFELQIPNRDMTPQLYFVFTTTLSVLDKLLWADFQAFLLGMRFRSWKVIVLDL